MPRLPDHDACKRCGDDLTGFLRAIGVCGRCMQIPPVITAVPRPTYSWQTPSRVRTLTWLKR